VSVENMLSIDKMERKEHRLYITSLLELDLMALEPSYYVSFIA